MNKGLLWSNNGQWELDFCWLQQRVSFILQQSILYLQTLPKGHQTDSGTSVQELNSRILYRS